MVFNFLSTDLLVHVIASICICTQAQGFNKCMLVCISIFFIYKASYSFLLFFFYTYIGALSNITRTRIKIKVLKRSSHKLITV